MSADQWDLLLVVSFFFGEYGAVCSFLGAVSDKQSCCGVERLQTESHAANGENESAPGRALGVLPFISQLSTAEPAILLMVLVLVLGAGADDDDVQMTGFTTVSTAAGPGSWGTGTTCDRLTGGGGLPMPSLQPTAIHHQALSGTSDWPRQLRRWEESGYLGT